jgi:hypothetical protein
MLMSSDIGLFLIVNVLNRTTAPCTQSARPYQPLRSAGAAPSSICFFRLA